MTVDRDLDTRSPGGTRASLLALHVAAMLACALWWGGLTFYAGFVVPIGTAALGSVGQGFITQQVTNWLNILGGTALVLSARDVWCDRRRWIRLTWSLLLMALATLVWLHGSLDALLDRTDEVVLDSERFYQLHRVYLWGTVVQWLAGMLLIIGLVTARDVSRAGSTSQAT